MVTPETAKADTLQDLFLEAPLPMCILEGERLTFTFANAAFCEVVGARALVGKAFLEALPELAGQGFDTLLAGVMASGTSHVGKERRATLANDRAGGARYFDFIYHPRRGPDGAVNGVLILGADVTAKVTARRVLETDASLLQKSERRLRHVVEATGAGLWELDLRTQTVTADAQLRALHGFPAEGPVDLQAAFASARPADQVTLRAATAAALDPKGDGRYCVEYRAIDAHGRPRWIEARGRAFFDASGVPSEFVGTALDITVRKEAELSREGLLAALEAQPFVQVCVLEGPQHVVTLVNGEYRTNVAQGRDLVGLPIFEAFPEMTTQGFPAVLRQVVESGEPFVGHEVSTTFERPHGVREERFFNLVVQPVRGAQGQIDTLLNISHDVTPSVEGRRVLERAAVQEKDRADFERLLIGIVSHDLRNPLSAIRMGVSLLLRQEDLAPSGVKLLLRIQSSVERMVRLVNDLLDFTQARLGTGLQMANAPMSLHTVVAQVVEELRMAFPDRTLTLDASGDGDGVWDADRISQVALNLITNALKYSPATAEVAVRMRETGDRVELAVFNPGTPIPEAALANLFKPMQRGLGETDPSGRSVGLGLFIVKHVVDALGGTIGVSSAGAGTTFTISLPRGQAA